MGFFFESVPFTRFPLHFRRDQRISLSTNNQTIKIEQVRGSDEGRYTCQAENKAGRSEQDFNLEVLSKKVFLCDLADASFFPSATHVGE